MNTPEAPPRSIISSTNNSIIKSSSKTLNSNPSFIFTSMDSADSGTTSENEGTGSSMKLDRRFPAGLPLDSPVIDETVLSNETGFDDLEEERCRRTTDDDIYRNTGSRRQSYSATVRDCGPGGTPTVCGPGGTPTVCGPGGTPTVSARLKAMSEEPYVFSIIQAACVGAGRMKDRRRSDPGDRVLKQFLQQQQMSRKNSLGLSPSTAAASKDKQLLRASNPRLAVIQSTADDPGEAGEAFGRAYGGIASSILTCSSTGNMRWAKRAHSLPGGPLLMGLSDHLERAELISQSICGKKPAEICDTSSSSPSSSASIGWRRGSGSTPLGASKYSEQTQSLLLCPPELPRRRRSVSLECYSRLEAIAEEGGGVGGAGGGLGVPQESTRRYSVGMATATANNSTTMVDGRQAH